jgi:hypothetical protein
MTFLRIVIPLLFCANRLTAITQTAVASPLATMARTGDLPALRAPAVQRLRSIS